MSKKIFLKNDDGDLVELPIEDSDWVKSHLERESITPTTHISRIIHNSLESPIYIDNFRSSLGTKVVRFGINIESLAEQEVRAVNDLILAAEPTPSSEEASGKSKKTEKLLEAYKRSAHLELEKLVFSEALNHLFSDDGIKTVLVDTLAREGKSSESKKCFLIKFPPERHTILLYKNPPDTYGKNSVLVIDPTSIDLSYHIRNEDIAEFCIVEKLSELIVPVTSASGFRIYKPESGSYGSDKEDYRDCADIAVKIAFNLNSQQLFRHSGDEGYPKLSGAAAGGGGSSSSSSSSSLPSVWHNISNFDDLKSAPEVEAIGCAGASNSFFDAIEAPVRYRQSSDTTMVSKIYHLAKVFDLKRQMLKILSDTHYKETTYLVNEIKDMEPEEVLARLKISEEKLTNIIDSFNEESHQEVLRILGSGGVHE